MKKLLAISLTAAFCGSFAAAQQMTCQATNASVIGSYTYIATEMPFEGVGFTPPGTTNSKQVYSNTPLGLLIGNLNTGQTFGSAGSLYFDGAGHVLMATAAAPLSPSTQVGTYNVNSDCTINVTLTDIFNTVTSGPGVTNPTLGSTSLIGMVLAGGSAIDLSLAQSSTSTNGNTPLIPGVFASRAVLEFVRSFQFGCSAASLTGAYGLVGTGFTLVSTSTGTTTATPTSTTAQPATFFADLTFDGNGNVITIPVVTPSPIASFQYSGTYTVNLNCTGTLTLTTPSNTPAGTSTGTTGTVTANFVLIPTVTYAGSTNPSGSAARPSLLFNTSAATASIMGVGRAQ
jgi:hypothetical protein